MSTGVKSPRVDGQVVVIQLVAQVAASSAWVADTTPVLRWRLVIAALHH